MSRIFIVSLKYPRISIFDKMGSVHSLEIEEKLKSITDLDGYKVPPKYTIS